MEEVEFFYRCRMCNTEYRVGLRTGFTGRKKAMRRIMTTNNEWMKSFQIHQCDDLRTGIAEFIGVKTLIEGV